MRFVSLLLGVITAVLWLFPSPGRMGMPTALALVAFCLWLWRLDSTSRNRVFMLLVGLLIVFSPGRDDLLRPVLLSVASVVLFLSLGKLKVILIPAAVWVFLTGLVEPVVLVGTVLSVVKGTIRLSGTWLLLIALTALVADATSWGLMRGDILSRSDHRTHARWRLARVLNRSRPEVQLRQVLSLLHEHSNGEAEQALELLTEIESEIGRTNATTALKIAALARAGHARQAKAYFAEAGLRVEGVLDSLLIWDPEFAYWGASGAFLHNARPAFDSIASTGLRHAANDTFSAEYLGRALIQAGLEAEACTLARAGQWRDAGWARYLFWKTHTESEPAGEPVTIGREPVVLPEGGEYLVMKGQPARGEWPCLSISCGGIHLETTITSEFWTMFELNSSSPCSLRLLNDLRSPTEDRNLCVKGRVNLDSTWAEGASSDLVTFLPRMEERIRGWGSPAPRGVWLTLPDGLGQSRKVDPVASNGAIADSVGWLIAGTGWIRWENMTPGKFVLLMRGEPARSLWPVVELTCSGTKRRFPVDSWGWRRYEFEFENGSSELVVRYMNDYWDPAAGEDRNLRVAGLYVPE